MTYSTNIATVSEPSGLSGVNNKRFAPFQLFPLSLPPGEPFIDDRYKESKDEDNITRYDGYVIRASKTFHEAEKHIYRPPPLPEELQAFVNSEELMRLFPMQVLACSNDGIGYNV